MCGITGKLHFDPARPVDRALIQRMCAAIRHRGPDDQGIHLTGPVGLGHLRLAIIDLSPGGHQPMGNAAGTVWITFNGEIYNYLELKRDLEAAGEQFRTRSDTEVLLRLYERDGVECLRKLRGMFAFAIWDGPKNRLFMARDRLGVKPLVYHLGPKSLVFGSEIKALLQDPEVPREIDPVAIHHYLTYQAVPAPNSVYQGIQKLPPAHYLMWENGKVTIERWWKLEYGPKFEVRTASDRKALEEELVAQLTEAVRLRLISDVPFGAFLSGGIDSSAVVGLMSRLMDRPVRTFSIGFEEDAYDETDAARAIAQRFGADHTEFKVRPDALDLLPRLVRFYDEPYADASCIPTYIVSQMARAHVTVVLNGDAGDENFAGYDRYVANALAQRIGPLAPVLGSPAFNALLGMLPHGENSTSRVWRLKRFTDQLGRTPQERNVAWMSLFDNARKAALYTPEFRARMAAHDSTRLVLERYRESGAADFLDATLYADIMTYLPDTLLTKVDIASMAHALEARSPFLDYRFMEFAARIPARLKLEGSRTKSILKSAMSDLLPTEILARKKMGFNVPMDRWLRNELRPMTYDLLLGDKAIGRGYFDRSFVERMLGEHMSGRWNWHSQIFSLLMLELWHQTADPAAAASPLAA